MTTNAKIVWELLGFGLLLGGPVAGSVILSNKSPAVWAAVWGLASKLLRR
jgi:hypothetical protein